MCERLWCFMDGLFFPILIALAVMLGMWGLVSVVTGSGSRERKRLNERLTSEGRQSSSASTQEFRAITLKVDVQGLPPFLAEMKFVQSLHRKLILAYPGMTL